MRRPYTIARYAQLVERIRRQMPDASIGTDAIVGFPGESDEDFGDLADYLERSPITHVHVFPYSDRPGTRASSMPDKVPGSVIRDRARILREVSESCRSDFERARSAPVHRALTLEDGTLAVTGNYLKVRIPPGHARNEWLHLRITDVGETLSGVVV